MKLLSYPPLRQELESLLKAHEEAAGFMESPAIEVAAEAMAEGRSRLLAGGEVGLNSPRPLVGQSIGPYQVLSFIATGGMGEVYLARDTRLNRLVALKVLSASLLSDPEANQRLWREARAAATLDHPNICTIYEIAEADGCNFIVMQYIKGETLAHQLKRQQPGLREVLNNAVQVADALQEAHAHGIIHRDIKPANITSTRKDS